MAAIADVEADLPAARSRWLRMALGTRSRQGEGVQNSGEPGTLFGSFREGILSELISGAERRRLSAGSLIFEHGSRADNIYFVLSGSLECQLLREDRELGLEAHTRPNPPINEVVALESPARGGRSPFAACDFVLEEPAPLRSSRIAHPKLLKSVTAAAFPASSLTEPASVRSTHPSKEKPSKSTGPSVCTMTPREALRRDDRLLRPVADVVRALAASIPAEPKPELESFQQRWQQFQAHVGGLVDTRTQKSRDAGASTARAMKVEVAEASAAEEPPPKEDEPAQQELLQAPSPRARLTRLVAVCKEVAGPGDIVGAVACLASQTHKWTALAGDGCEVLALSASSLKRAVKRELSCRHSERTEKLLMALGHLRALDEDKLHQLAVASRSVLYRRGEVLCWEGDLRTPQSHLEVLMTGEARRLRATVESANTAPSKDAPKLTRTRSARSLASMQHAGSLIAGQAANASSVLADCGEPFTVVVESAELMGLSLSWADLVRFVPAPLLEELKGWALQRLAWHRTQISKLLQEVKQVENSSAHGGASKKLPERSLLNGVLHDQPEMICRKAKQPPGSLGDDGRDMLTSTLAIHRRPDPLTAECPTVHEALIPYMKGHAKPPESPRSAFASSDELTSSVLLTSTSNLWDEPAAELLEKVVRTCEDWGLRKISAAATKLHKRESFNSGLKPWRKERIVARGCSGGALVEVRPIEPLQIARCLPSSRPSPELPALTAAAVQEVVKKMPFRGKAKSGRHLSTLRRGVSAVCPPLVPVQAPLWSPGSTPPRSASKSRLAPLGMLPLADKACRPQKTSQPEGPKVRSLDAFLVKGPRRPGGPRRLLPRHVHLS